MDIIDFLLKTLFELIGWIFNLFIKLAVGIISFIVQAVAAAFSKNE